MTCVGDRADGNTGAIIAATIAVAILLAAEIIVVAVLTVITYRRKKRQSKVEIPIPEPIYDDPDNPCYAKIFEYKVPRGAITSPSKTTAVPMPPINENLAYIWFSSADGPTVNWCRRSMLKL